MRRTRSSRIALAALCWLVPSGSAAQDDSLAETERWVPAFAFSFDILGQRSEGAVESDRFIGPPLPPSAPGCETSPGVFNGRECLEPVRSSLQLTPNARGHDTTTAALVALSLELMTPKLADIPGRPRLFAQADGSLAYAFQRKLAGEGKPGIMAVPPPPQATNAPTNVSEQTISGQGNRSFSEVQHGIFSAGAGIAITVNPFGRTVRIKPSFAYLRQEVEFEGLANRAIQIRGSNAIRPDSLDDFRLLSFSARTTQIQHGIGGGLELEADTQSLGPFLLSVFVSARAYHILGDLDETLCSDQNEVGPSFSPDACETGTGEKVTWRFEPDNLAWRGGVGLRFRFLP